MESKTDIIFNKALEYLNSTEVFLQDNIPKYLTELLTYNFYDSLFHGIISMIIFIICLIFFIKIYKKEDDYSGDIPKSIKVFISVIFVFLFGATTLANFSECIKIKVAPRVYLIDYVKSSIRNTKG